MTFRCCSYEKNHLILLTCLTSMGWKPFFWTKDLPQYSIFISRSLQMWSLLWPCNNSYFIVSLKNYTFKYIFYQFQTSITIPATRMGYINIMLLIYARTEASQYLCQSTVQDVFTWKTFTLSRWDFTPSKHTTSFQRL